MDGFKRCDWALSGTDSAYIKYHDEEWGVPVHDDRKMFEFLLLEGAQAGLSWAAILRRREGYRMAFADFAPKTVAGYGAKTVEDLLGNSGIIRNRSKIDAAIQNARSFLEVQEEFGSFDRYIWGFVPDRKTIKNRWTSIKQLPAKTRESEAVSKDLIKRGFKFVGPTICYAYMQATGMVNDHITSCFRYDQV